MSIMTNVFYNRAGEPITGQECAKLLEDTKYRVVKIEHTPKKQYKIATVWQGIDASLGMHGDKKLIFVTFVLERKKRPRVVSAVLGSHRNNYTVVTELRSSSEDEAAADRKQLIAEWAKGEQ